MDQENLYNQIYDHFEGARDPEAAAVMGVAVMKESTFLDSRFCQILTNAKEVRILFLNFQLQPKS